MRKVLANIKNCPYTTCGHQAVLIGYDPFEEDPDDTDGMRYQVECETCCATGPLCDTEDAAIQEWNAIERHEPKEQQPKEQQPLEQAPKERLLGEAYETKHEIVIIGQPKEEDENLPDDHPSRHNCDRMGCGQAHVLYRFKKAN